jgi:hypothetical protein
MIREAFKDGLPSDLQVASSTIASIFNNIEYKLNNPDLYGGVGSIASDYIKALPLLQSIEFNRKEYENAYKTLTEKGGMKEVAINSLGQIAVQTEDGFSWVSPEEYHNNKEEYIPITALPLPVITQAPCSFNTFILFSICGKSCLAGGYRSFLIMPPNSSKLPCFNSLTALSVMD